MRDQLSKIEGVRRETIQLFAESAHRGFPIAFARKAVSQLFRDNNMPEPKDILAFASGGEISDADVRDWQHPTGGN